MKDLLVVTPTRGMYIFNKFISDHKLIDLPLNEATYTWSNSQLQIIRSRIDRFLITADWESHFPSDTQMALARPWSNHCPIAFLCDGVLTGPSPFRFESLKLKLKSWAKEEFGHVDRQLEDLEEIFVQLDAEEDANNGLSEVRWNLRLKARQDYCNLITLEAELMYDQTKIKAGIVDFFKNVFQDQAHSRPAMDGLNFKSIPADLGEWLERDIDEEEVVNAIKLLGKNKSPRPDGYPIAFYQQTWSIIRINVMKAFAELQNKGFPDWRLKNTFIALISKKDSVEEIKDPRPISLVNGVYKILSKVLAERFKVSLPHVISQHHYAFIKQCTRKDGLWFEVEKMGAMLCGTSLSAMMLKAQEDGYLSGFQVKLLRIFLLCFELLTGLHINFAKSRMFVVDYEGDMSLFTSLLGCYNSTLLTTYLGLPLGDKYKGIHKWDKIVDRFTAKLAGWKRPFLSGAGKIVLIKSVLPSLPVYFMSLFEMPKAIELKLERIMRKFLWNNRTGSRKIHLVG
ncbi:uncharacterized protein LOC113312636 [Papaver somniferum]|uniref:uncharacterized protein LOC113312636 n=1 Tax=Papaver somniferum TaxID=3469 RepID=UPI000E6FA5D0|nr:uncharacterized protein LOC113312636 [Papaver somniferum]